VANLVRRLEEPRVAVVLVAACPAPHSHMTQAAALLPGLACWLAHAGQPRDFLRHTGSKRMPERALLGLVSEEWHGHPKIMP
jgi:hypothetical protein